MADNADMNRMILGHARRGEGVVEHLGEVDTQERRSALNDALSAAERAIKHGDEVGREMAEARIDSVLAEARAAGQTASQEEAPQVSFDGGVRRALPSPPPSMNRLLARQAAASAALAADARAFADAAF
jgi:hypothetical protein